MIKFNYVSIQNFMSYGAAPTVFNLNDSGTTLIVGEDLDNVSSGTGANGVGKTSLLNGLVFGLYGKPVSNISLNKLVNNINNTHLEVILEFEKDNKIYTIKRVRKEKSLGNYVKVFVRNPGEDLDMLSKEHDQTPDSVNNINSFIENILGIPYEIFVRIVAFTATHTPFLDLPVRHASQANQSGIMEELFRLNRLSEKADALKAEIKDTKQSMDIKKKHNEQLEKEHSRHNLQLTTAKERVKQWDEELKTKIDDNNTSLKEIDMDYEAELNIHTDIDELNNNLSTEKSNKHKIEVLITEINSELKTATKEVELLSSQANNDQIKFDEWVTNNSTKISEYTTALESISSEEILKEQTNLHELIPELKAELKEIDIECSKHESTIKSLSSSIKTSETELKHLEDDKCPYCLQQFADSGKKVEDTVTLITNDSKLLEDCEELLKTAELKLKDKDVEIDEINSKIEISILDINIDIKLRNQVNTKLEELRNVENPHKINDDNSNDEKIEELNKVIILLNGEIEKENVSLSNIDETMLTITNDINDLKVNLTISTKEALYEIKSKINSYKTKIEELGNAENPHLESYGELKGLKLEPIDMEAINKLDKILTHQNYLLKLLTKKDSFIRKHLLNKNLEFLNGRLKLYLSEIGLPHRVEFTHEMTANITQFGRELDFGNLSSGQKARVNLALSLSFRDVLQQSLDSVNVCMLDEVLDVGLDTVGVQSAARMLKRKARDEEISMFIISHRDEVNGIFDKKLTVQLSKGFSNLKSVA